MSIRKRTIEENGKRTVCVEGSQTLTEAIQAFENLKYLENDTYLVVSLSGDKYNVILFSDLKAIMENLGPNSLTQLSNLPIPPASRIVPTDTEESGGDIIDWVASHPQARVVVTDAGKFAALFVNCFWQPAKPVKHQGGVIYSGDLPKIWQSDRTYLRSLRCNISLAICKLTL